MSGVNLPIGYNSGKLKMRKINIIDLLDRLIRNSKPGRSFDLLNNRLEMGIISEITTEAIQLAKIAMDANGGFMRPPFFVS